MNRPGFPPVSRTVLDELLLALERAAAFNTLDQVAPAVILWTDKERQWEPVLPALQERLPQLLGLGPGEGSPFRRQGPAIWLRCMLARALPEADWPAEVTPVLYLPGVSRHELRAVESCPRELQPLAELQYRGVWFTQESTKDWTVLAFLTSERGGLGLELATDQATREAMLRALPKLLGTPVAELRGKRLQDGHFNAMLQPDLVKQMLRWLDSPQATRTAWTPEEWDAFRGGCLRRFSFDPEQDGELAAAERLGARDGAWGGVWDRFAEAPQRWRGIPERLHHAKPAKEDSLFFSPSSWPQCNEAGESELRAGLSGLKALAPPAARAELQRLETVHGPRRSWVWAALGLSPLAHALEALAQLGETTRQVLPGATASALADSYVKDGWQADAAALEALSRVSRPEDVAAVKAAVEAVYRPWLEEHAERLQGMIGETPAAPYGATPPPLSEVDPGTCLLFSDGLRLDLGKRLRHRLEDTGLQIEESWRWVPFPAVTPTAKPAISPVADLLGGSPEGAETFQTGVLASGQLLTTDRFRSLLKGRGFQVLGADETGDPSGRAWAEHGDIDSLGHDQGWKLAGRLDEELQSLEQRVHSLLRVGWKEVRVVTDHGWLLLPGGLPKSEMPKFLVESRWSRCAALKPGAVVNLPTAPWHWDAGVTVARPPGISSFTAGVEYAHGGLSLQECIVLTLAVKEAPGTATVTLEEVRWVGMRCRARAAGVSPGFQVDLRRKAADPTSTLSADGKPRPFDAKGEASLVVQDADLEGTAALVVVLDPSGSAVAKRQTIVGGDE